jgi:glycosyltransferase involved in cell wall biosynthesis
VVGDFPRITRKISSRCVIIPPAPVPYRERLFESLHRSERVDIRVVYQSSNEPSWDMPEGWFPSRHRYPADHLRSWQRGRSGRTPIVWPRGLERALREANPDCVVAWEYGPASLRALRWCRAHRRAYVVFTECTPQIDSLLSNAQLRLHRWVAGRADGFIATSSQGGARLRRFGVREERITVALQAADLAAFRATPRGEFPGEPFTVLAVGRLVPDKNHGALLEAFARARLADARLEIVGSGPLERQLRELARRLAIPVRFRGPVQPHELPALYAAADAYALPSTYEPFGVSVREAAAAGLPIICSRLAGAAGDVALDGRNALLIDPSDVPQMADALRRLATDEQLRRRMAAESRAIDAATDGSEVESFIAAIERAAATPGLRADQHR